MYVISKIIIKYIKEITDQEKHYLINHYQNVIQYDGDYGCGGSGDGRESLSSFTSTENNKKINKN